MLLTQLLTRQNVPPARSTIGHESYYQELGGTISVIAEPLIRGPLKSPFFNLRLLYLFRQSSSKSHDALVFRERKDATVRYIAIDRSYRREMKRENDRGDAHLILRRPMTEGRPLVT